MNQSVAMSLELELAIEDRAVDQSERNMDGGTTEPGHACRVFVQADQRSSGNALRMRRIRSRSYRLEPSLPTVAATPSGSLAYQVREYLQAFIERDRFLQTRCFSAEERNSHARARDYDRRSLVLAIHPR